MNVFNKKQKFLNEKLGKNDKQKILKYLYGDNIVEVGCGSGVNLNLIEQNYKCNLTGIDISDKVIETLKLKKEIQNHSWNVFQGNGLYLNQYFKKNSIDTLIFCSVIHELFSYTKWQGQIFNYETIKYVFENAYNILKPNGRIIIRDGIMSDNNDLVIIKFINKDGILFFKQYVKDFKGRKISYDIIKDTITLHRNDAMEFLYTYTWGYEAYACEVQEQYGYFTKLEYTSFINNLFRNKLKIIKFDTYLQQGYINNLNNKIKFFDNHFNKIQLPDSNCLLVLEKIV